MTYRMFRASLLGRLGAGWPRESIATEPPLRAELFSAEQMALHGKVLADSHFLAHGRVLPDRLLARLDDNERTLFEASTLLTAEQKRLVERAGRAAQAIFDLGHDRLVPRLEVHRAPPVPARVVGERRHRRGPGAAGRAGGVVGFAFIGAFP